ncbi:MAG: hypothetical protein V1914_00445 [archaeon]
MNILATKKLKVKTKAGKVIVYPVTKVKQLFLGIGFTGKLLTKATGDLFKEAKNLTKGGVVSAIDLERAVVKTVHNTNKIATDTGKKFVKKLLK